MNTADTYIKKLNLVKHPEGGYFREVYRSPIIIDAKVLDSELAGTRNISTSIYFLLDGNDVSNFHKIKSDEIWHHYEGASVKIYVIDHSGLLKEFLVGKNIEDGESLQLTIPAGCWFCAEILNKSSFALVGCTVSPGFDFNDFELADYVNLSNQFPGYRELIRRFTPGNATKND